METRTLSTLATAWFAALAALGGCRGESAPTGSAPEHRGEDKHEPGIVQLEGGPHFGAGAMEEYALVSLGKPENATRLFRGETLDVAERDHGPLVRGQRRDRGLDPGLRLSGEQALLRDAARGRCP